MKENFEECFYEERERIRKDDEKNPNKKRYLETDKDISYSDWCIVTLKNGKKVFTRQIWHVFISWVGLSDSDVIDWDYASNVEIYINRKKSLLSQIDKQKRELENLENELKELEILKDEK